MPDFQVGRFVPDVLIEKNGKKLYVEVELHTGKEAKWRNMHNALGYVALCGRRPKHEAQLVKECVAVGADKPIYSTSLTDLITNKKLPWEKKIL